MRSSAVMSVLVVALLTVSLAGPVIAGQSEDAKEAYDRGDYVTAYRLNKPLADHGNADAQFNLGIMYYDGLGVPQDYIQSHMWFNLAASRTPASEEDIREQIVKNSDLVASKMTPAQIAEAKRLAREWKPKKEGK